MPSERTGETWAPYRRSPEPLPRHATRVSKGLAPNVLMLDRGCLWGGTLTAIWLEDRRVFQIPSLLPVIPKPFG